MSGRTVRDLIAQATAGLAAAGVEDARSDAWLLLEAASGRGRASLMARAGETLPAPVPECFEHLIARRRAREPLAYILGQKEFWSLPFRLAGPVLVPRPDSETVVEAVLATLADRTAPLRVMDFGTGSGCLLLALLSQLPNARGIGVDLDPVAVRTAAANARDLGLAGRTLIVRGRWGEAISGAFDVLVSNPPYVTEDAYQKLAPEIRRFEPPAALLAGADGLDAYRALAPHLARLARPGAVLAAEHGEGQGQEVAAILAAAGLVPEEQKRDLAGIERVLRLTKK